MTIRTSPNSPIGNSATMLADTTEQVAFRGIAAFVRPANTTPYDVGDVVGSADSAVHKLPSIGQAGAHYEIQSVQLSMSGTALPSGMGGGFRIHFYTAEPATAADASTYANAVFDRRIYVGYIDVSTLEVIGGGFLTRTNNTDRLRFQSLTNDIWAEIVTLASNGFTPVSGAQVELDVRGAVIGKPSPTANSPLWLPVIDYRKAEQLPLLSFWFAEDRGLTDRIRGLTLDFTRTTPRTFNQADNTWGRVGINEPAFSYSGGVSMGLDIWDARTNLFLNSAAPATQDITVTAAAHTLSFRGTGSITLSGASTAGPLDGTGANDRVSLTLTPSAGTLTLTLSGDIREPQFGLGTSASPYIETGALPVIRTADICTLSDLSWFDPSGGVFYVEWAFTSQVATNRAQLCIDDNSINNRVQAFVANNQMFFRVVRLGSQTGPSQVSLSTSVAGKLAIAFTAGAASAAASNGTLASAGGTLAGPLDLCTILRIGRDSGGSYHNGTIARLDYYGPGAAQSFIQRMTE
jgi:hypothetical protein